MKIIIITIALTFLLLFLIIIGVLFIDDKIKIDTKFGKWWDKHISHKLDPDDPNF